MSGSLSSRSLARIKKYPALIPIYVVMGIGPTLGIAAGVRTLLMNPDVSVARHKNPEPWEAYRNKQYKFFGVGRDYSKVECPAPVYYETDDNDPHNPSS